ncbi:hypothetical protein PMI01_02787 [Caulobacter sp. AP07]|uniref:hypothetical protein n=1 Tax=Caulobacter sp. AP07 TaxID=1144304 RepID=UPI0002721B42|nr:hypothetical protein [Caulobacter sp. AP07]EJL31492.1 hypothetical protein PMI01_02787 [Caulobacter sp. AP07]
MQALKPSLALALAVACATTVPAFAAPARISDGDLLRASRCLGLARAQNLGAVDAKALSEFVEVQRKGRDPGIRDRSDSLETAARREGSSGNEARKAALTAERDGACKTLIENPTGA